jgi:acetyl-CoA C-acetyltransferase
MKLLIAGQYIAQFGELWEQSLSSLLEEASLGAIRSAQIESSNIEAVYVSNMLGGILDHQLHLGALVSSFFAHYPPSMRIEGACASGGMALIAAEQALLAGTYKTVLVVGAEKMTDVATPIITAALAGAADAEREFGSTFPALYALLAQEHMRAYGTTRDQLSAVSVKNHQHALTNSWAQFHKAITMADVNQSQIVADPLRLLDCSPVSDGAAAVVLTTKKVPQKPQIIAAAQANDTLALADRTSLTSLNATVKAAKMTYKQAGIKPTDIAVAEVHDCFTIAEIMALEDLGFCRPGQGGPMTLAGKTTTGGVVCVNPSGGLKAAGHPVGATGIKQVAYLAEYVQREAVTYALAHNVGGSGATAVVHIIGK